jgi:hypothetical protein
MLLSKQIVCLANSRKWSGRCIAGKEIRDKKLGGWVRPVRAEGTGELSYQDIRYRKGGTPKLLDIITVPLVKYNPHSYQTENYLVDIKSRWIKTGVLPVSLVPRLCDTPATLWINGYNSLKGCNDRIPLDRVEKEITSSLYFIEPASLAIIVENEYNDKRKVRAEFIYNEVVYKLAITDPEVEIKYLNQDDGSYQVNKPQVYLCVSLGEPYNGYCYKLVAGIINLF